MAVQKGPSSDDMSMVQFRIERGAQAEASDGAIGTVEQIVVDSKTGELRALIIRAAEGGSEFELPATHIARVTGSHVYLDLSQQEIARNPKLAQPYDPSQYRPVYVGRMGSEAAATEVAHETEHPVVTDIKTDSAQVVAPVTPEQTPGGSRPATATDSLLATGQPNATGALAAAPTAPLRRAEQARVEPAARPPVSGEPAGGLPTSNRSGAAPDASTTSTPPHGMYADFTAAPEVVDPFEAMPAPGMTPQPDVTNAPVNPTRHPSDGVLERSIVDTPLAAASPGQQGAAQQHSLDESRQLFHYDDIYSEGTQTDDVGPLLGKVQPVPMPPRSPASTTTPLAPRDTLQSGPARRGGPARDQITSTMPSTGTSLATLGAILGTIGLGAGLAAGMYLAIRRRQARPSATTGQVASNVTSTMSDAVSTAQDAVKRLVDRAQPSGDLAAKAQQAAAQVKQSVTAATKQAKQNARASASDAAATLRQARRRARWFRRGVLAGAGLGILYAPRPGRVLREQLAHRINRMLNRAS
ncbi:MAG: hypothetical protein ACHQ4H_03925 [Ktedonobacterales bacterium]